MTDREMLINLINTFDNTVGPWLDDALHDENTPDNFKTDISKMFNTLVEISSNICEETND